MKENVSGCFFLNTVYINCNSQQNNIQNMHQVCTPKFISKELKI